MHKKTSKLQASLSVHRKSTRKFEYAQKHPQASKCRTDEPKVNFHFYTVQKDPKEAILIYVNVNLTQYGTVKNDVLFIIHY